MSLRAPQVGSGGAIAVIAIVVLLHIIKPEMEPSWRFVSEYAIGEMGWIMKLGFMAWAASCFALSRAALPRMENTRGRAGAWLLTAVAISLIVAGIFPQDAVTTPPGQATTAGGLHALATLVGIPGIPIAALLISSGLPRDRAHGDVRVAAHATWISLVLMIAYLAYAVPRAGGFNPSVYAGWMNRLVVLAYLIWQLTLARTLAIKLTRIGA